MLFISVILLHFSCTNQEEILRHVHVVYRHGDRTPARRVPSLYRDHLWPQGIGQLTVVGIRQQFGLGQWLRGRYGQLLSGDYFYKDLYVRSTDMDRTLMSAQANLAGLYFNDLDPIYIIPGVHCRPIPVHTAPLAQDSYLISSYCTTFLNKVKESYNKQSYRLFVKKYERTLDIMRKALNDSHMKFEDTWQVYDNLLCERLHNFTWASWVTSELFENISEIYRMNWKMRFYGDELGRLSGGRLLDEIVTKMSEIANTARVRNQRHEKMRMYSGHDTTLSSLMSALGINDGINPPYAACLLLELFQISGNISTSWNKWIVKIYYRTKANDFRELPLTGCNSRPCTLDHFVEYTKERVIKADAYRKLCPSSGYSGTSADFLLTFLMILVVIIEVI